MTSAEQPSYSMVRKMRPPAMLAIKELRSVQKWLAKHNMPGCHEAWEAAGLVRHARRQVAGFSKEGKGAQMVCLLGTNWIKKTKIALELTETKDF